jgi:hypothetical protein
MMAMEKYGAEVPKYEVVKVIPFQPDDREVIATDLTLSEAKEMQKDSDNYMVRPIR